MLRSIFMLFFFQTEFFIIFLGELFVSQDSIKLASKNDNGYLMVILIQICFLNKKIRLNTCI